MLPTPRFTASPSKLNAKLKAGNGKSTYKTSDKKVAEAKNGKVTIKGTGSAIITVQAAATANYNRASAKAAIKPPLHNRP